MRQRTREKQHGLTLVELLVGLAIMSVMLTLGLGMTSAANRAYADTERRQAAVDLAVSRDFIRRQIESAAPIVERVDSGRPIIDFAGSDSALEFISADPLAAEAPVLQHTRLYIDGEELILERTPLSNGADVERRTLAGGVARFRLAYYEAGVREPVDAWRERSQFPALILVELELKSGRALWAPLAARPHLAASW